VFKDAILHDVSWPARWGSEILDVVDFREALPGDDITAYKEMEKLIQGRHATVRLDIPQQVRGVDYQLCPWCTIALCPENNSNHLICKCGASFCFVCGKAAFDRPGGFNHWGHGGCPRYGKVGSGHERFSDGQYDNSESHLVPLERVYGSYLYVNSNGVHLGKAYKDDTELCWETCNHRHDLFDRHGWKYPSFEVRRAVACLKFNLTMQTATKAPHRGITLRRLLDKNSGPIVTAHRRTVLDAISPPDTRNGIHVQDLETQSNTFRDYGWCFEELVDDLISLRPEMSEEPEQYYPFVLLKRSHHLGLLRAPIGGIFHMYQPEQRMNALQWLNHTVAKFQSADDPKNLAIFSELGPSSTQLQLLSKSLQQRVLVLPCYRVTFEIFTSEFLLVWVRARSDPEPGTSLRTMPIAVLDLWRAALMDMEQHDFERLRLVPLQ
jgi:hypothetical protein